MTLLFKISGFLLIIFTTSALGFLKSNELSLRYKKLCGFRKGITDLKERIRLHGGEIDRLVNLSFKEYPLDYSHLEKGDIEIMEDFFKNIGMSDTAAEYERCELYITLLESKSKEAEERYSKLGRLYRNIGILGGIFLCIFFL